MSARNAFLLASLMLLAAACAAAPESRVVTFVASETKVRGTATIVAVGQNQSRIEIEVQPDVYVDMPAHVHPGRCGDMLPQPKFPLENVQNGLSTTFVPASLADLSGDELAINLHRSNDDMSEAACADLRYDSP